MIAALLLVVGGYGFELKKFQFLFRLVSGELMDSKTATNERTESGVNLRKAEIGFCPNTFIDFMANTEARMCLTNADEALTKGLKSTKAVNKKYFNCKEYDGNGTLILINSVKELIDLLASDTNGTAPVNKSRSNLGNCVLVLFYARSCPSSAQVAPHFNALPRQFHNLKIAAVDALKYTALNSDFGIIALPTVLLFHQSRPVVKYNETVYSVKNFIKFIHRHTSLASNSLNTAYVTSEDFKGPLSNKMVFERDPVLWMAWAFIVLCSCYYFSRSRLYNQFVDMVKRNWRESGAQHDHQN